MALFQNSNFGTKEKSTYNNQRWDRKLDDGRQTRQLKNRKDEKSEVKETYHSGKCKKGFPKPA